MRDSFGFLIGFLIGMLVVGLIYTNYVDRVVVPTPIPTNTYFVPTQSTPYVEPTWTPFYAISVAETPTSPSLNQVLGQPEGSNPFTGENP